MTEKNIKYLLGIDGGGTKTEFLLTDLNERKNRQIILGTSNPVNIGTENCKSVLGQGISEICEGLDYTEVSVFAGLAGSGSNDINAEIHRFLGEFGFGAYSNGSDADSVLEAALKGKNGAAVIMGTGIIAFSRSDEKLHRTGGRGYMIDKGGSGFCFGSDALNSAFEYLDGRGGSKLIFSLVEKKLGKSLENSVAEIYSGGATYVASFAPVIFEAYKQGDNEAERIIDRNAREAAKIIAAARSFLDKKDKTVICGGLCKQKDILKPFLLKYIGSDFPLIFSDEPTVNGTISLAKLNI
ncbi:MAG: hypothetical protein E7547_03135 [Ruminococcaceae bacterium]|nr:hypothetical protein [Oscillospiraceae bacterium]